MRSRGTTTAIPRERGLFQAITALRPGNLLARSGGGGSRISRGALGRRIGRRRSGVVGRLLAATGQTETNQSHQNQQRTHLAIPSMERRKGPVAGVPPGGNCPLLHVEPRRARFIPKTRKNFARRPTGPQPAGDGRQVGQAGAVGNVTPPGRHQEIAPPGEPRTWRPLIAIACAVVQVASAPAFLPPR